MTSINKLTKNTSVKDPDLFVLWDSDNQRTRSIEASALAESLGLNGVNANAFVSGRIENNILIMTNASGEDVVIGEVSGINLSNLTPNTVPILNQNGDALVDSGITETSSNIIVNKTLIVPQESILIGPAVKISDKGGYLGVSNIAEDTRGFSVVSKTYETEAQRDLEFADGVPRIDYQYLVPAKWVYQFPFDAIISNDNLLTFEFQDSDNTFIRKLRMFSTTELTGVRVWIENILPSGDALVWENVSPENQEKGQGLTLSDTGFSELDTGFIKISTANIRFRFSIQAMAGENLNLVGSSLDLGFGTGFYPKMYTYTQDSIKTELLDGIDTAHNRFGEFKDEIRLDSDNAVVRSPGAASDEVLQPNFDTLVDNDRPDIIKTNGNTPMILNSVTVKHQGTWGPVQVSFSDLRTTVVNLVDGDNTITVDGKPLVIEDNEDYYIRFTGAVGTGSQTQISLLGDADGEVYSSINKSDLVVKEITLDGIESIVAGNNITVNATDPKNPIISASGGSGAGITIDIDGVELNTGINTLDFDSTTMEVTDLNPSDGKVEISAKAGKQTNFVGIYADLTELNTAVTNPTTGDYAHIVGGLGGEPDIRYEYQSGNWVDLGPISGEVFVDGNKSAQIITGTGLSSDVTGDNITIRVGGGVDVVELDVDADNTITLDSSFSGKFCSIVQSTTTTPKLMTLTLSDFSAFDEGSVITISRSQQYTNYYFTVLYRDGSGAQRALYPNNNVKMVRGKNFWDIEKDGKFTDVSVQPKSVFNQPYVDDSGYTKPVDVFVFSESDSISFEDDIDSGGRIIKIDLDSLSPDLNGYVKKYSRADLDYVRIAYGGKYNDDKTYFPAQISQDSNGLVQEYFTESKVFKYKDKDTGAVGDKVLELKSDRVTNNKQPYFNDKKLAVEHTSPIFTKLQTQRTTRPDFPPASIYVDAYYNTIMEANGDFKFRYVDADGNTTQTLQANETKWNFLAQPKFNNENLITQNSDASFNKVNVNGVRKDTAYNNFTIKGSSEGSDDGDGLIFKTYIREDQNPNKDYIQYFGGTGGGNQLANTESVSSAIAEDKAKGEWIGGVLKDTINDGGNPEDDFTCNDPKQWLEYRKTSFNGSFALTVNQGQSLISSEVVIHLHVASGMTSAPFKVVTNDGKETTRTIRIGEKWRFYLRTGAAPYFELIDDGLQSGTTDSDYDGEGFGVPGRTETGNGTVVQKVITGNYRNTSNDTGDLIVNLRTDDGVKNFRFYYSLPHGTLSGRKVFAKVDEKAGSSKTIRAGEIWQCEIKAGQFFDDFFWQKITDGESTFVLEEDFNAKSGYSSLVSGGGSTKIVTYGDNAKILKISNSTVKVGMLQDMNAEDKPHGYFKYINTKNADVNFEWYDRNGTQVTSNVPSICPANVVVEVFADYSLDQYVITFGESKIISSSISEAQIPSFTKFINKSSVTVDYPFDASGDQYRPNNVIVTVLDTSSMINSLNITVASSDTYNGNYNSVGAICIDEQGEWSSQSNVNAYRLNDGTDTYCVYSKASNSWVLVAANVDHNNNGSIVGGTPINLYNDGQLPESYGDYSIQNNLDSIESEYFTQADTDIDYHTNSGSNSYFTVKFGNAKPAGVIFYK